VQTPPALPVLLIGHIVSWLRWSKLIIDWHNYGHTIVRINRGKYHPFVHLYKLYEKIFGRGAYKNFCVSQAMKDDLKNNWKINATVLYDTAQENFGKSVDEEKKRVIQKIYFWGKI